MSERIIIPQETVSENSQVVKDLGQSLTFFNDYILFESESESNVEDEKLGLATTGHFKNKYIIDKKWGRVETYRSTKTDNFVLILGDAYIAFKEERDCQALFEKIIKWKYGAL